MSAATFPANQSNYDQLPILRLGQMCTPGRIYKVECNTCRCGNNNILLCTKMACLDRSALAALMKKKLHRYDSKKYQDERNGDKGQAPSDLEAERRHIQRKGRPQVTGNIKLLYPELPVGNCKPGKIYQVGCNRCFCNADKKVDCVEAECDDEVNQNVCAQQMCLGYEGAKIDRFLTDRIARTPKDVRTPFTEEEVKLLPVLSHASAKCLPGAAYRVDCNSCLCLADGNTLCGDLLCISYEDMDSIVARQRSGAHCDQTTKLEQNACVTCACLDGVQQCTVVPDCGAGVLRSPHGDFPESLDPTTGNCVPGSVYKEDCNRCYCQPDYTLRCTRKKCLNYVQVNKLKKLREELEKNGL